MKTSAPYLGEHARRRARGAVSVCLLTLDVFSLHLENKLSQELLLEMGPFTKSTFRDDTAKHDRTANTG